MSIEDVLDAAELTVLRDLWGSGPRDGRTARRNPSYPEGEGLDIQFAGSAPERVSRRSLQDRISAADAQALLTTAFARQRDGRLAYPSSGGVPHLRFILVVNEVDGLPVGTLDVVPRGAGIRLVTRDPELGRRLNADVCVRTGVAVPPALVIVVLSEVAMIAEAYTGCTLATALWDAGVFLGQTHAALARINIPSCIVSVALDLSAGDGPTGGGAELCQLGALAVGGRGIS